MTHLIRGDVKIAPNVSGDLQFLQYGQMQAHFEAEDNHDLQSLYFESGLTILDVSPFGLSLRNLSSFRSITAPVISTLWGNFSLIDLPVLETINMSSLWNVGGSIRLARLPKLKTFIAHPNTISMVGDLEIKDVPLDNLDPVLTGSFQNRVTIEGIPNVKTLSYKMFHSEDVTIHENGELVMEFASYYHGSGRTRNMFANSMTLYGLKSLTHNASESGHLTNFRVGALRLARNSFETLEIDLNNLTSLYVQDNANLTAVRFHPNASTYSWREVIVTGNPKLTLTSTAKPPGEGAKNLSAAWV